METSNLQCLKCFKRDKEFLKTLEEDFDSKKVFIGFLTDSGIIAVTLSKDITFADKLIIADTIARME